MKELPYTVRVSSRASCARLRVLPGTGLEVVLPRGAALSMAADLVYRHTAWIERALRRVRPETDGTPTARPAGQGGGGYAPVAVPDAVRLHGGTRSLPLRCLGEEAETDAIVLRAHREDTTAVFRQLRQWVREYAARSLDKELADLAVRHGFCYTGLRFGYRKSLWGSCTAHGVISLNICLVFLPFELARHVLLHELAHTRHCDHGQGFWKVLFAAEPDALTLDKRLRRAWRHVPDWIW